jgi:hypothetical protein
VAKDFTNLKGEGGEGGFGSGVTMILKKYIY